ncbi:MAG: threonine/serine dehydratase [Pseudomonadota bacterium]
MRAQLNKPNRMISTDAIEAAHATIAPAFLDTPVLRVAALDRALGCELIAKVETLTPIRSFKGRGADNMLAHTDLSDVARVVCASAGNFGWGVAHAARTRGVPATIYAAETANPLKMDAIRDCGATVVLHGPDFDAAKLEARARAEREGWVFLNDGAHDANSAGAGSIAKEMTEAGLPFETILVPLGNGALVNGIGSWLRTHRPDVRVVAVAAEGAPSMERSWRVGRVVKLDSVDTIADGLGVRVRVPVPEAVAMMAETTDEVVLVSDAAMLSAMRLVHRTAGPVLEPSGAAGVAAVLCGSNIDPALLPALIGDA